MSRRNCPRCGKRTRCLDLCPACRKLDADRNKSFPVPSRNIEWTKVRAEEHPEIEERKNIFVYYRGGMADAVVFWGSTDAAEAQRWLHSVAFARCCEPECGIRVRQLGLSCGNHRSPA